MNIREDLEDDQTNCQVGEMHKMADLLMNPPQLDAELCLYQREEPN